MKSPQSNFPPLKRSELPELEASFQKAERFHGYMPNYILSMSRLPAAVEAYAILLTELYDEVTLPDDLALLVSLQASRVSQCRYSIIHAAKKAYDNGASIEKIEGLKELSANKCFDKRELLALEFAKKSATAPCPLDRPDFEKMACYFSETEICEILFIVAQTGFQNRWNGAVNTELEPELLDFVRSISWLSDGDTNF